MHAKTRQPKLATSLGWLGVCGLVACGDGNDPERARDATERPPTLGNLTTVGDLEISGSAALTSLRGLEGLVNVDAVSLLDNSSLTTLDGLEGVSDLTSLFIGYHYDSGAAAGNVSLTDRTV